jgi:Flp pilus assembly protein TadD
MSEVESSYNEVIIFAAAPSLLDAIRAVLKELGARNIIPVDKAEEAVHYLKQHPAAPLIIDFACGPGPVHKALAASQADVRSAMRPIFLVSAEPVQGIDGLAAEFGVSQVHVGELTKKVIKERLIELGRGRVFEVEMSNALIEIANLRNASNWRGLEDHIEQMRNKYPNEVRLIAELAESYLQTNRFEECERLIKPLVSGERKDPRLLNLLGRALLKQNKFDEATVALSQAKIINPFNIDRLIELGEAYLMIDIPARAKLNFKQAGDLDPGNADAVRGSGKTHLMLGEINEALPFLRELSGPEEAASVFNTAAILCMRNGRHDDGFNLYRFAIKAVGKNNAILAKLCFNLGIGYHRSNDATKAKKCFAAALHFDPNYDKAKTNLQHLEKASGAVGPIAVSGNPIDSVLQIAELVKPRGPNAMHYADLDGADYDLVF